MPWITRPREAGPGEPLRLNERAAATRTAGEVAVMQLTSASRRTSGATSASAGLGIASNAHLTNGGH